MASQHAETQLETIAKSIQASEHISYSQAYAHALEQNPHLYSEEVADSQARILAESQAQPPRQFDEPYSPGRGFERAAEDRLDKAAQSIQASENLGYHAAYAKALERDPSLYETHAQGAVVRQLSELGVTAPEPEPKQFANSDMWGSSTPAGVARSKAETELLAAIETALGPYRKIYPRAPERCLLAVLFDNSPSLRRRAIAACRASGTY